MPPRILVVEDSPLIADLVEAELTDLGFEVVGPAATVAEAERYIDLEGALAAALLDIRLESGTTEGLAELLAARGIPFVVVTGYPPAGLAPILANAPTLLKPFRSSQLADVLRRLGVALTPPP